jgi:hypothetical protein
VKIHGGRTSCRGGPRPSLTSSHELAGERPSLREIGILRKRIRRRTRGALGDEKVAGGLASDLVGVELAGQRAAAAEVLGEVQSRSRRRTLAALGRGETVASGLASGRVCHELAGQRAAVAQVLRTVRSRSRNGRRRDVASTIGVGFVARGRVGVASGSVGVPFGDSGNNGDAEECDGRVEQEAQDDQDEACDERCLSCGERGVRGSERTSGERRVRKVASSRGSKRPEPCV